MIYSPTPDPWRPQPPLELGRPLPLVQLEEGSPDPMSDEADYTPWPADPLPARRDADWLHFYGPDGERAAVPITVEGCRQGGQRSLEPWTVTDNGDGTITVAPSINKIGHWHSPNPVVFRLVDELPDPKR